LSGCQSQNEELRKAQDALVAVKDKQLSSKCQEHETIKVRSNELLSQNQALQDIIEKLQMKHRLELENSKITNPKPPLQTQQTSKWLREIQELKFEG
jgi:hypothetical protein